MGQELAARRVRWWSAAVAVLLAGFAVLYFGPVGDSLTGSLFSRVMYPVAALVPTAAALLRARESRGGKRIAYCFAACAMANAAMCGVVISFWPHLLSPRTSTGVTLWFTVVVYASGVLAVMWATAERRSLTYVLDGLLIAGSLAFVAWEAVITPVLTLFEGDATATVLALTPPAADVMMFTMLLLASRRGTHVLSRATLRIAAGAELLDALGDLRWASDGMATPLDATTVYLWLAYCGVLSIAVLAPDPDRDAQTRPASVGFMVFPYVAPLAAACVAGWLALTDSEVSRSTWVLGSFVVIILILRQLLAVLDNIGISQELARSVETLRAQRRELERLAMHDPLTALPNRRFLSERVSGLQSGDAGFAVLLLDVDDFKQVNDRFGHDVGDALLVHVAACLSACVRAGDVVARLGGDEFAVVLRGADEEQALITAQRIADQMATALQVGDVDVQVRLSIGLALGEDVATFDQVLRRADMAMYERSVLRTRVAWRSPRSRAAASPSLVA